MAPELKFRARTLPAALIAGLALCVLIGAAAAFGAAMQVAPKAAAPKAAAPKAAPKAEPKAAPKAPAAGPGGRPTQSAVTPESQLLLVPSRQLKILLNSNVPIVAGESAAAPDRPAQPVSQWSLATEADAPKDHNISFSLYSDPTRGTKLVVANGSDQIVIYEAVLLVTVEGRGATTLVNTCSVPPGGASVEFWGVQVDAVLVPKIAATPNPVCFDPTADRFYPPGTPPPSQIQAQARAPAP